MVGEVDQQVGGHDDVDLRPALVLERAGPGMGPFHVRCDSLRLGERQQRELLADVDRGFESVEDVEDGELDVAQQVVGASVPAAGPPGVGVQPLRAHVEPRTVVGALATSPTIADAVGDEPGVARLGRIAILHFSLLPNHSPNRLLRPSSRQLGPLSSPRIVPPSRCGR